MGSLSTWRTCVFSRQITVVCLLAINSGGWKPTHPLRSSVLAFSPLQVRRTRSNSVQISFCVLCDWYLQTCSETAVSLDTLQCSSYLLGCWAMQCFRYWLTFRGYSLPPSSGRSSRVLCIRAIPASIIRWVVHVVRIGNTNHAAALTGKPQETRPRSKSWCSFFFIFIIIINVWIHSPVLLPIVLAFILPSRPSSS